MIYQDIGDYKEYYIEELENEIKRRIVTKLYFLHRLYYIVYIFCLSSLTGCFVHVNFLQEKFF